jgi:hypothetical protein
MSIEFATTLAVAALDTGISPIVRVPFMQHTVATRVPDLGAREAARPRVLLGQSTRLQNLIVGNGGQRTRLEQRQQPTSDRYQGRDRSTSARTAAAGRDRTVAVTGELLAQVLIEAR